MLEHGFGEGVVLTDDITDRRDCSCCNGDVFADLCTLEDRHTGPCKFMSEVEVERQRQDSRKRQLQTELNCVHGYGMVLNLESGAYHCSICRWETSWQPSGRHS